MRFNTLARETDRMNSTCADNEIRAKESVIDLDLSELIGAVLLFLLASRQLRTVLIRAKHAASYWPK